MIKYLLPIVIFSSAAQASSGMLQATCDNAGSSNNHYFSISFLDKNSARVEVNSNQIYVNTRYETQGNDEYIYYFKNIDNIGRAGAFLSWDNFSSSKPMFSLKKLNNRDYIVNWYGFYDNLANSYAWTEIGGKGPELYSKSSVIYDCTYY
ncbi:hypothetical protein [Vibrio sinaloensis]|uniref:hypothetical protein n=1 Tax=Photobacterium sp. (strain ATCC 43367) TaxID=379097 RepID=UPI0020482E08|nr:hypothetical protein [Vibrio sinaloensis]UPQ89574.1 hypothetical protein MTO69_17645 [Vibrio sinaloensis]